MFHLHRQTFFIPTHLLRWNRQGVPKHHHKHQVLDPLISSISRITTALANVSVVFQLFFFLVVCSDMISSGFGLVTFFASVKTSSVCIHLSCLVCIQSVVHGVRSRLFCGHKGCSETSAYKIQTPGNYQEDSIQHSEQDENLKSIIKSVGHYTL